jgi:hypothetical protein
MPGSQYAKVAIVLVAVHSAFPACNVLPQVHAIACDVSAGEDVQRLADFAADRLGVVHR